MTNDGPLPICIHATALIEADVNIGEGTAIWDGVHIRRGARIGKECIIGEKTYVAYDVCIGNYCKLNASVYVCAGVTIGDSVMLSAHTVFTNDRFPRAFERIPGNLATSEPTGETLRTTVGTGVTTGANVTIGPGVSLGDFAMIGMGSVVTHDVSPHALVVGNPGRVVGYVCMCGPLLVRFPRWHSDAIGARYSCQHCGRRYRRTEVGVSEVGE